MPGATTAYGFQYPLAGEPVADYFTMAKANAEKYEAALLAAGVPASSLTALTAAGWFVDTGPTALPLLNGGQGFQGTPYYRRIGKRVFLFGAITGPGTPGSAAASTIYAAIPSGLWPSTFIRAATPTGATSGDVIRRINVNNVNGQITVNASGTGAVAWQSLDGIFWDLP